MVEKNSELEGLKLDLMKLEEKVEELETLLKKHTNNKHIHKSFRGLL